ncbi:MAG: hypothetical protein ACTSU2_15575 [Promethearchaeota archaeon]
MPTKKELFSENLNQFISNIVSTIPNKGTSIYNKVMRAISMFKSQKNLLYIMREEDSLQAVVKSQSHPEKLEYATYISQDGNFYCLSNNLRACGGLRGQICKHIILTIIAAIKNGDMEIKEALTWIKNSVNHRPAFKYDQASSLFGRYKRSLDGTLEWRPVEMFPEDFYAF